MEQKGKQFPFHVIITQKSNSDTNRKQKNKKPDVSNLIYLAIAYADKA